MHVNLDGKKWKVIPIIILIVGLFIFSSSPNKKHVKQDDGPTINLKYNIDEDTSKALVMEYIRVHDWRTGCVTVNTPAHQYFWCKTS